MTERLLISIIFASSPNKNRAKPNAEYSTLYPETSSASASGKSKGARFVSARIDIKKSALKGHRGIKYHIAF